MTGKKIPATASQPPASLALAVRKVLRPFVRLLLNFRITFPQMAELLKSIYIEVAEEELRLPGKPQTDARLSLLTGIHRKDVKRLRNQDKTNTEVPLAISIGGKLVNQWISTTRYQNAQGQPAPLPLKADSGSSFESLVQDICKQDIRPRVILDEWLNMGIVTLDSDHVTLNTQAFIPSKGVEEKAFFLGHNISDHLAAATHNIMELEPSFFERCVYYDGLSEESIEQLRELAADQGMQTLININNLAAVPSIIFGLLGLAIFINFFGMPRSTPVVGGLVLTLMTLPTIIIAGRASLKSVPPSVREAALGVGASKLQTITHHVLPLALPGMLTGTIIGMAQALGETAPLLMIGMVAFIVDVPSSFTDPATALPVQIFLWSDSPERAFTERTSAAIMILLTFLIFMNATAVVLRKKFEIKW